MVVHSVFKCLTQFYFSYTPCGWGKTMLEALEECVRAVNRFPYQG
jgi:hypothetical protein